MKVQRVKMKIFFAVTLPIFLLPSWGGSKLVQMNLSKNGKPVVTKGPTITIDQPGHLQRKIIFDKK